MNAFNWLTWLEDACAHEPSMDDAEEASHRAQEWPTCACGQLCKDIPRSPVNKCPEDFRLQMLGLRFSGQVDECRWRPALKTFREIEARTLELLTDAQATPSPASAASA